MGNCGLRRTRFAVRLLSRIYQRAGGSYGRDDGGHFLSPAMFFGPGERTGSFRLGEETLLTAEDGKSSISYEDFAVALIDGFLFRVSLTPEYVQLFATVDLPTRLAYFMLRAFNENVFYRLFLFSALAWLFGTVWRDASQRPAVAAIWGAMIVAQITNIAINVVLPSVETVTPTVLLYDAIRYVAPGVVWAYHFARFGFATAEIASVSCHLFLQPALGILIR